MTHKSKVYVLISSFPAELYISLRTPFSIGVRFLWFSRQSTHQALGSFLCLPVGCEPWEGGDWDLAQVWHPEDAQKWLFERLRPVAMPWGLRIRAWSLLGRLWIGWEGMPSHYQPAAAALRCESQKHWFLEH